MLGEVFAFWISVISSFVSWLFTLKINENPDITIGMFLLGCATIGIAIYFILGTDFIPGISLSSSDKSSNGKGSGSDYHPKHLAGEYHPKHARKDD